MNIHYFIKKYYKIVFVCLVSIGISLFFFFVLSNTHWSFLSIQFEWLSEFKMYLKLCASHIFLRTRSYALFRDTSHYKLINFDFISSVYFKKKKRRVQNYTNKIFKIPFFFLIIEMKKKTHFFSWNFTTYL